MAERPRHSPIFSRTDLVFGAQVFALVLTLGVIVSAIPYSDLGAWAEDIEPGAAGFVCVALIILIVGLPRRWLWPALHAAGNHLFVGLPQRLVLPFVVDGDTIDDLATGVRYRIANIDAPETGDNARCGTERSVGFRATQQATALIKAACRVEVRKTWRHDQYGRRIAFVLIDGQDMGKTLVRTGFAHPWRGSRERWCGAREPLSKLAAARAEPFKCEICARR